MKLEASAGRAFSKASRLSTSDRPTAGSIAGGALAEDRGFFPLSACFGAMTMERAERRFDWKEEQSLREAEESGKYGTGDGRITVYTAVSV